MNSLYIITGASKGIGDALATLLEAEDHNVLRIARTNPNKLPNLLALDITEKNAPDAMIKWINQHIKTANSITLINNAGTIDPIGKIGMLDDTLIELAFSINVAAPIRFTNQFIATLNDINIPKYIMNISSGAGRNAYIGWGVYCATKAALDHFTSVLAEEQKSALYPVKVTSIAPGVIDTDMQKTVRSSSKEAFPNVDNFVALKETGSLSTPKNTAKQLLDFLHSDKMEKNHVISDVRDRN